jgi:hypothetical protein
MPVEAPLPTLPVYEKPKPRVPAVIPDGVKAIQKGGVLNKMISRMLPKLKTKSLKKGIKLKAKEPTGKPGKKRHKVHFV